MKRLIVIALLLIAVVASAETTEEHFQRVSKDCAVQADRELDYYNPHFLFREKCRRIDSLHDMLARCAHERNHLRIAAGCSHKWEDLGPGRRGCPRCRSIADYLGGEWMVVYTGGLSVGPDPLLYPNEYNLGPVR